MIISARWLKRLHCIMDLRNTLQHLTSTRLPRRMTSLVIKTKLRERSGSQSFPCTMLFPWKLQNWSMPMALCTCFSVVDVGAFLSYFHIWANQIQRLASLHGLHYGAGDWVCGNATIIRTAGHLDKAFLRVTKTEFPFFKSINKALLTATKKSTKFDYTKPKTQW